MTRPGWLATEGTRACLSCSREFVPRNADHVRCTYCARVRERARKRKYHTPLHRALRARWDAVVRSGRARCARCGEPIAPGAPWDLGHVDEAGPSDYSGPEHRACNRATRAHRAEREGGREAVGVRRVGWVDGSPGWVDESDEPIGDIR